MPTSSVASRRVPGSPPLTLTIAVLAGLLGGCGQPPRESSSGVGRNTDHTTATAISGASPAPIAPVAHGPSDESFVVPPPAPAYPEGASLTVEQIVQRAIERSPTRAMFEATKAAAIAEVLVARAWANPQLEISGGVSRPTDANGSNAIYGVGVSQRFELPGKRSSRIEAARAGQAVADREVAIDVLTLEHAVREACFELASAEAAFERARTAHATVEEMYQAIERRAAAKEAGAGDVARAKLELVTTRAFRDRSERLVIASRTAVRLWSGGGLPQQFTIEDALPIPLPVVDRQAAMDLAVKRNPQLELLRAQADARTADLAREQRAWQPDITVGAFANQEVDADNQGLRLGIEVPVWNHNQGRSAVAEALRHKAQARLRVEQQVIEREVDLAWQMYESRRLVLKDLLGEAKTAAQAALDAKLAAFSAGEVSLLDLFETRRAAQTVDQIVLEARREAADAWLALGRAVGSFASLTTVSAGDQP